MKEYNTEEIGGYTVHSFYVECPYEKKDFRKSARKQRHTVLRYFAFIALAPFALFADAMVAIFR